MSGVNQFTDGVAEGNGDSGRRNGTFHVDKANNLVGEFNANELYGAVAGVFGAHEQ